MDNSKKTFFQRFWKAIAAITVVVCSVIGAASNLTSVLTFFHISLAARTEPAPIANVTSPASKPVPQIQTVAPVNKPVTQVSSGSQSPNLNGIHGSVDLRYGATEKAQAFQPIRGATAKTTVKANATVVQVSSGAQSANISNVGGDVKLIYGSQTAPATAQN